MSDNNKSTPIVVELVDEASGAPHTITVGDVVLPLVSVTTPARERKLSGGGVKKVAEKTVIRVAPFNLKTGVAAFTAAALAVEAANPGDGDRFVEKHLGKWVTAAYEDSIITSPSGEPEFSPDAYAKALVTLRRAKTSTSSEDLSESHKIIMGQLIALSDLRESWRAEADRCEKDADGHPINHPWTDEVWAGKTEELLQNDRLGFGNLQLTSFAQLVEVQLGLKDRRLAIEREMSEREARKREVAEKRKAKKAEAAAA